MKILENRIKNVLSEKKKTVVWLAKKMNMSASTIYKWNSNVVQPSAYNIARVAVRLKIEVEELIVSAQEE